MHIYIREFWIYRINRWGPLLGTTHVGVHFQKVHEYGTGTERFSYILRITHPKDYCHCWYFCNSCIISMNNNQHILAAKIMLTDLTVLSLSKNLLTFIVSFIRRQHFPHIVAHRDKVTLLYKLESTHLALSPKFKRVSLNETSEFPVCTF